MKKLCLFLALVLVFSVPVYADVIVEPEDSFYWAHRGECARHDRTYSAYGTDTTVAVYGSPESPRVVERVPNGELLFIDYVYEDGNGISWGYTETTEKPGWVPMDYLWLQYDNQNFLEEFSDRITWRDKLGRVEAQGTVRFWAYPGSQDCQEWEITQEDDLPECSARFTDDAGRIWLYVEYFYRFRNFWVCQDDPGAPYYELYAESPAQAVSQPEPPAQPAVEIAPTGIPMGGILAAVGILAALSAGFLLLTRKKSKS